MTMKAGTSDCHNDQPTRWDKHQRKRKSPRWRGLTSLKGTRGAKLSWDTAKLPGSVAFGHGWNYLRDTRMAWRQIANQRQLPIERTERPSECGESLEGCKSSQHRRSNRCSGQCAEVKQKKSLEMEKQRPVVRTVIFGGCGGFLAFCGGGSPAAARDWFLGRLG